MAFTNKPMEWNNEGIAPSSTLQQNGFQGGYKPPASVFNYFFCKTADCINELQTVVDGKVDKETGKVLSTNDYTTAEKNKLAGISTGANKTIVDTALSSTSTNPVQNKVVNTALEAKEEKALIITVTSNSDETYSADKTFAEINTAYKAGKKLYVDTSFGRYSLGLAVKDSSYTFNFIYLYNYFDVVFNSITIFKNDTVQKLTNFSSISSDFVTGATAVGASSLAQGERSFACNAANIANDYQFVSGKYNKEYAGNSDIDDVSSTNTLFMVGNGTSTARSNAFRITADGKCRGTASFIGSGADFAEYLEWLDGNPNNEDRRGRFVTLVGDKIRIANSDDDYILGVVSGTGSFIGNSSSEEWQGKYLKDVFGEPLTQKVEVPEKTDEKTGEVIPAHTVTQFVLNPDYDPSKEYISREFRKEWSPVGFHGQVIVVDDGSCEADGYCKSGNNGIATASNNGYRVMSRIDDTHIKVLIK